MASRPDFVQYIADQCSGAGVIKTRKMFGDYGIYCNDLIIGLVCDNGFYLKPTEEMESRLRRVDMRKPYEGAKPYFYIEDIDDRDYLSSLVRTTYTILNKNKNKK